MPSLFTYRSIETLVKGVWVYIFYIYSLLISGLWFSNRYFTAPGTESERAKQELLLNRILNESVTVHLWNSVTSALIPEPESLITRLLNHSCIHCFDEL